MKYYGNRPSKLGEIKDSYNRRMFFFLIQNSAFDIFNLGENQTTTLSELIVEIENALGKKAIIERLPEQQGDMPLTAADISKARRLLGYNPRTPIRAGIPKFVDWYLSRA